ncbi:MAG: NADH-quinone oxidoreductase subunit A [Nitrospinota bacterium]
MSEYIPVIIFILIAIGTSASILMISEFIGVKKTFPEKAEPFECGESQIVSPKLRFSVKFYLVAILFVLFDIEAVFLYPWAVLFRQLGLFGFIEMMVFIFILGVGLVYVWKKGALEWE